MNRFHKYASPFQYYNPYRRNNFYNPQPQVLPQENKSANTNNKKNDVSRTLSQKDTVWLDLFGIKLYFDDVLILSLLFFLYKEEVKDEGLFLALVLLLIS